jgi:hypothetical protein
VNVDTARDLSIIETEHDEPPPGNPRRLVVNLRSGKLVVSADPSTMARVIAKG